MGYTYYFSLSHSVLLGPDSQNFLIKNPTYIENTLEACAAGPVQNEEDDDGIVECREGIEKIAAETEEIRRESDKQGARSSDQTAPTPGIVNRLNGLRTLSNDLAQDLHNIAERSLIKDCVSEQNSVTSAENLCPECKKTQATSTNR